MLSLRRSWPARKECRLYSADCQVLINFLWPNLEAQTSCMRNGLRHRLGQHRERSEATDRSNLHKMGRGSWSGHFGRLNSIDTISENLLLESPGRLVRLGMRGVESDGRMSTSTIPGAPA